MSREVFEVRDHDAAGRAGRLAVPRADVTIETPALMPVVNPHIQEIPPSELAETFGAQILITNAYVLYGSEELREPAERDGIRSILEFPGAIVTDSGSFQLAEYGTIDVDTPEILAFQRTIGSDIATPVDIPTPPDATRDRATRDLAETKQALEEAAAFDAGDMLLNGPVQGGRFPDLREAAGDHAAATDLDVYPVGAMVPLLRQYDFGTVSELVCAAKRGLGLDKPVHLFGAGHPMMFALGAALGCDLFDSAAYALYAREGRYMTVTGTDDVADLRELPCSCPSCLANTPEELARDRRALAEHNLHASFAEMRQVREAIRRGTLLELVEARVRAHPHLLDGYRSLLSHERHLEGSDPVTGDRPFFYLSSDSATRPAVRRHHDRIGRISGPEDLLLVDRGLLDADLDPWGEPGEGLPLDDDGKVVWTIVPPFGPVPPGLLHTYPLTAEVPDRRDRAAYASAVAGISRLAGTVSGSIVVVHDGWPPDILADLPATVDVRAAGRVES